MKIHKELEALAKDRLGFVPAFGGKTEVLERWLEQKGFINGEQKEGPEETSPEDADGREDAEAEVQVTREGMKALLESKGVYYPKNIKGEALTALYEKNKE